LLFDDDRTLAFDLALDRAQQADRAFGLERAFEASVLADQALDLDAVDHWAARQARSGQAHIDVTRRRAEARTRRRLAGRARRGGRSDDRVVGFRSDRHGRGFVAVL